MAWPDRIAPTASLGLTSFTASSCRTAAIAGRDLGHSSAGPVGRYPRGLMDRLETPTPGGHPVSDPAGVPVRRGRSVILGPLDWAVHAGERWVVLGPNGSGKTTLLQVVTSMLWPTTGSVLLLGQRIGTVDARDLRRRVGYASPSLAAA